jgi:hypothetical protein
MLNFLGAPKNYYFFSLKPFSFAVRKSNRYKQLLIKTNCTMPAHILTSEDLREFKQELIEEIKVIIQENGQTSKKYLKTSEVQKLLKVSSGTLQTLRINGTLPYTKIGGIILYSADDISKVMIDNTIHNKF